MDKAENLPSPVEVLAEETAKDEAELTKLKEEAAKPQPEAEELEEESLPADDNEEPKPEPDGEKVEEPVIEEQKPETDSLSPRGQKRYKKLLEDNKAAKAEAERLKEENQNLYGIVQTLQSQGYTRAQAEEIAPQVNVDEGNDYQQAVASQARVIVKQELLQREIVQAKELAKERFQEDLKTVEKTHDILNHESPEYDDKLSTFIAELYQTRLAKNPKVRLTEVTKEVMELREEAANDRESKQVHKIAKQASKQAMSPSGGKTDTSTLLDKVNAVESEADLLRIRKELSDE